MTATTDVFEIHTAHMTYPDNWIGDPRQRFIDEVEAYAKPQGWSVADVFDMTIARSPGAGYYTICGSFRVKRKHQPKTCWIRRLP